MGDAGQFSPQCYRSGTRCCLISRLQAPQVPPDWAKKVGEMPVVLAIRMSLGVARWTMRVAPPALLFILADGSGLTTRQDAQGLVARER